MNYPIDFSIFDSPTHAYGNVTGEINLPTQPVVDQEIVLDKTKRKIISLTTSLTNSARTIVGLDDIVVSSKREAELLANRLETELGLFCIAYDEMALEPETEHRES